MLKRTRASIAREALPDPKYVPAGPRARRRRLPRGGDRPDIARVPLRLLRVERSPAPRSGRVRSGRTGMPPHGFPVVSGGFRLPGSRRRQRSCTPGASVSGDRAAASTSAIAPATSNGEQRIDLASVVGLEFSTFTDVSSPRLIISVTVDRDSPSSAATCVVVRATPLRRTGWPAMSATSTRAVRAATKACSSEPCDGQELREWKRDYSAGHRTVGSCGTGFGPGSRATRSCATTAALLATS